MGQRKATPLAEEQGTTMEPLAQQSKDALGQLSEELFNLLLHLHKDAPVKYLIVTVEKTSGVVYAPITNLSRELLGQFNGDYAKGDLIEKIRSQYLFPRSLEGPIRDLWAAARKDPKIFQPHHLLVRPIRSGAGDNSLSIFDSNGEPDIRTGTDLMEQFAGQLEQTSSWQKQEGLSKLLTKASFEVGAKVHPFLLLRLEASFAGSPSFRTERLDLVQLGLALHPDRELTCDAVKLCLDACRISGLVAFSVLYEKERYYERAARQCVVTSAVKYGPLTEIKEQADVLVDLEVNHRAYNLPMVDKARSDPKLFPKKVVRGGGEDRHDRDEVSWYRMPWLELRSLADTLLWKGGSRDFELAALMRATVSHLRQVHWHKLDPIPSREHPKEALLGPLLLAKRAAERFFEVAEEVKDRVQKEFPLFRSSTIKFYRRDDLSFINELLTPKTPKSLQAEFTWHDSSRYSGLIKRPQQNLEALCELVCNASLGQAYNVLKARALHADAHFGNFLVDASVPEDPLIISIDPKPFKPTATKVFAAEIQRLKIEESDLDTSLTQLRYDPLYDLAKCVMSTSGLHGLIIRRALELRLTNHSFVLANPPDGVRHLTDTGGMSSAGLIRVGTQVRSGCLKDHDTCAGSLLREIKGALGADSGKPGVDPASQLGINIGLIRLWALSLRALLSAACDRLPSDMSTGSAFFVLASIYADVGSKEIAEVLRNNLLGTAHAAAALEKPFRWYRRPA